MGQHVHMNHCCRKIETSGIGRDHGGNFSSVVFKTSLTRYINKIRRVCLMSVCTNPSGEAQRFTEDIPDDLAQPVRLKDDREYQRVSILHHESRDQLACHTAVPGFDTSSPTLENSISGKVSIDSDILPHTLHSKQSKSKPDPLPNRRGVREKQRPGLVRICINQKLEKRSGHKWRSRR